MAPSPNLNLPYLYPAQSQKHVTVNESLATLDAVVQLSVFSMTQATPPVSPDNGDRYLVPAGATGAWAGLENTILIWQENTWRSLEPVTGWRLWVEDIEKDYIWNGTEWMPAPLSTSQIQNLDRLGVNSEADATNRVVIASSSVLLDNEGNHIHLLLNKEDNTDSASLIFQTDHIGKAEIGLTGTNNFEIKVSSDGSTWTGALTINQTNAECAFHKPLSLAQYSNTALPSASEIGRLIFVTDAAGGAVPAYSDGSNWRRTTDATIIN